jgi:hypothetical protein
MISWSSKRSGRFLAFITYIFSRYLGNCVLVEPIRMFLVALIEYALPPALSCRRIESHNKKAESDLYAVV